MAGRGKILSVCEHQSLRIGQGAGNAIFEDHHFEALQRFYADSSPYFSLLHKGVKFNEFVGVLQVGNLIIEVLPKMDRDDSDEKWRAILLGMLRAVGIFDVHAPSNSNLSLKAKSILDLYFELFISEVEKLVHAGLAKKYRKSEGNKSSLKGRILFGQHIRQNLVHHERFYVSHVMYDQHHALNQILYKTLQLLQHLNTNSTLSSRIGAVLLNFPEMEEIRVSKELFLRINYSRRTGPYRKAIEIAKLLLLQYHPDVTSGDDDVLALMFDMNVLWEQFVYVSLRKSLPKGQTIESQCSKDFWRPDTGTKVKMRPDIVVNKDKTNCYVLDTKWKNLEGKNPSPDDLRQMFTYSNYFQAPKTALVYPADEDDTTQGTYLDRTGDSINRKCAVIRFAVNDDIKEWRRSIAERILAL
jgi:5-methylcytosine-specific restriction enzyme subunit McrC